MKIIKDFRSTQIGIISNKFKLGQKFWGRPQNFHQMPKHIPNSPVPEVKALETTNYNKVWVDSIFGYDRTTWRNPPTMIMSFGNLPSNIVKTTRKTFVKLVHDMTGRDFLQFYISFWSYFQKFKTIFKNLTTHLFSTCLDIIWDGVSGWKSRYGGMPKRCKGANQGSKKVNTK